MRNFTIIALIILLLSGCTPTSDDENIGIDITDEEVVKNEELEFEEEIRQEETEAADDGISSELYDYEFGYEHDLPKYIETMSSVPGLPIKLACNKTTGELELSLVVKCDSGVFLIWHDDGSIENVGMEYRNNFESETIYWSPLDNYDKNTLDTMVTIWAEKKYGDKSKEIMTFIQKDDSGYYSIGLPQSLAVSIKNVD